MDPTHPAIPMVGMFETYTKTVKAPTLIDRSAPNGADDPDGWIDTTRRDV
jgi:hypothetical protein